MLPRRVGQNKYGAKPLLTQVGGKSRQEHDRDSRSLDNFDDIEDSSDELSKPAPFKPKIFTNEGRPERPTVKRLKNNSGNGLSTSETDELSKRDAPSVVRSGTSDAKLKSSYSYSSTLDSPDDLAMDDAPDISERRPVKPRSRQASVDPARKDSSGRNLRSATGDFSSAGFFGALSSGKNTEEAHASARRSIPPMRQPGKNWDDGSQQPGRAKGYGKGATYGKSACLSCDCCGMC
jgi:hypothetical protein